MIHISNIQYDSLSYGGFGGHPMKSWDKQNNVTYFFVKAHYAKLCKTYFVKGKFY